MKQTVLVAGALYGLMSVILGAFGAHLFKNMLTPDKLSSFEVGVKYQMYHALLLLIIGFYFSYNSNIEKALGWLIIDGTFLFCMSIYLLSFADYWGVNLKFLGPITPIGGALMIAGWGVLLYMVLKNQYS